MTPLYVEGMTVAGVAKMIPTLLLPFNLTKALLNAAIVLTIYKPVSRVMKRMGVVGAAVKAEDKEKHTNVGFSIVTFLVGILVIAICLVVFFVFLDGDFSLTKK